MITSVNPAKEPEQELKKNSVKRQESLTFVLINPEKGRRPSNINATHRRSRHRKWDDLSNGYSRDWKIACWWKWSIQPTGQKTTCTAMFTTTSSHLMYDPEGNIFVFPRVPMFPETKKHQDSINLFVQWSRAVVFGTRATAALLYPGRSGARDQESTSHNARFAEWKSRYITLLFIEGEDKWKNSLQHWGCWC